MLRLGRYTFVHEAVMMENNVSNHILGRIKQTIERFRHSMIIIP
jgi:hypothetical protein